ncbi:hypothetical protein PFDG_04118 [Plasmodium falciparum Dd2]|uniref:Glucose-1-phosphate adenylyltransferase/Bifunctional protein GlmU-like C-terminal hexapeptide domain-containing protein n=1 Tax=Plasmodium falciparum (isolate Dd2) TaxID=57267 RepID=A0A0L7M845_PLAF4|nr:hypothetical protein PFDG_04118 [Plasmodium falciparum Dd2]
MYNTLIEKYEGHDELEEGKRENLMLDIINNENVESVVCYIQPKNNGFCQRINSIPNFFKANLLFCVRRQDHYEKHIASLFVFSLLTQKTNSFKDCIISSHFDHEENILLKKSILGKNVTIKKNSSINRSILMDNITIHEKCVIQNSIICDNVVIEENCKSSYYNTLYLIDCIIKENSVIQKNSVHEKETLPLFIS